MKNKLKLNDVTLLAISSVSIEHTQDALMISSHEIDFASVKLISSLEPKNKFSKIEYHTIPKIDLIGYNKFMVCDLHKFFNTSHCLIVQSDSFVVNTEAWTNDYLNYDYIGAPWTETINPTKNISIKLKKNRVGNGGFSLRSKKLANFTKEINFAELKYPVLTEDILICYYLYDELIKKGIKFAPIKLASKFSVEHPETNKEYGINNNNVFGFHGKHLQRYFKDRFVKNRLK